MKTIIVKFVKNKQKKSELCSHTEEGKLIFLHYEHAAMVNLDEVWECSVFKELDYCIIVIPVQKSTAVKKQKIPFLKRVGLYLLELPNIPNTKKTK